MKCKEELNALKEEVKTVNKKLAELNDDELEQVAAGGRTYLNTLMICSSCSTSMDWAGNYLGQVFDCPVCGNHTFEGVKRR